MGEVKCFRILADGFPNPRNVFENKKPPRLWRVKAETEGFEPSIRSPVYTLSPDRSGPLQPLERRHNRQAHISSSIYFRLFFFFISLSLLIAFDRLPNTSK